jgi:hypothetical protein
MNVGEQLSRVFGRIFVYIVEEAHGLAYERRELIACLFACGSGKYRRV